MCYFAATGTRCVRWQWLVPSRLQACKTSPCLKLEAYWYTLCEMAVRTWERAAASTCSPPQVQDAIEARAPMASEEAKSSASIQTTLSPAYCFVHVCACMYYVCVCVFVYICVLFKKSPACVVIYACLVNKFTYKYKYWWAYLPYFCFERAVYISSFIWTAVDKFCSNIICQIDIAQQFAHTQICIYIYIYIYIHIFIHLHIYYTYIYIYIYIHIYIYLSPFMDYRWYILLQTSSVR